LSYSCEFFFALPGLLGPTIYFVSCKSTNGRRAKHTFSLH